MAYSKMKNAIMNCDICNDPKGWMCGSHYHCAKCGEVTGMMGHYNGECKPFSCEKPKKTKVKTNEQGK